MAGAQRTHLAPQIMLAAQAAQPSMQAPEGRVFRGTGRRVEPRRHAADLDFDVRRGVGDHLLQGDPPQSAPTFGKIGGDEDRERRLEFAHDGQCEIAVVAVTVIKGEAGETAREVALAQSLVQLIESDALDVVGAQMRQHFAQEVRRHFKMAIGLKAGVLARAHVMQGEDGADAGENRPQPDMRSAEIQRIETGTDKCPAKTLHLKMTGRLRCRRVPEIAEETVSRANGRSRRTLSHFRFERPARVCFLSDSDQAGWRMRGLFRWSGKWWPGVIPLLVLWGLAAWNGTAPLESELAGRSSAALRDSVLDRTNLVVDGRDVTVSANAFSV